VIKTGKGGKACTPTNRTCPVRRSGGFLEFDSNGNVAVDLLIVPGADHVDLYNRKDLIPFDKLDEFFNKNLA
jgi:hypothetical protein